VAGYVAVTFGMGGFADWLPTYFVRYHRQTLSQAGLINGFIVVVGGMVGTVAGSAAADWLGRRWRRHPYFLLSGVTMLASGGVAVAALYALQDRLLAVQLLLGAAVLLGWCYNGPINASILNAAPAHLRARANGISVLCIHLFGDAISPSIIGAVSDMTRGDLRGALMIVPAALLLSGFIWFMGWLVLPAKPRSATIPAETAILPPSPNSSAKSLSLVTEPPPPPPIAAEGTAIVAVAAAPL
jgi:sugar phosphate permease